MLHRLRRPDARFDSPVTCPPDELENAVAIPYAANVAVFFLNSPVSVHSVTVRDGTERPRRLVNWIAGLYRLPRGVLFPTPPTEAAVRAAWEAFREDAH
jgi:hypothetical protein